MIHDLPKNGDGRDITRIEVGDTVSFAHYYQPDSRVQFAHDIEWVAVRESEGAVLLVSKTGIYCRPLDDKGKTEWKDSSLREWLNSEFLQNSFCHGDETMLIPVPSETPLQVGSLMPYQLPVENELRHKGADQDYVFILNEDEIGILPDEGHILIPNWLALREIDKEDRPEHVKWWLRPGKKHNCVETDGSLSLCEPDSDNVFVRPAVWLDNICIQRVIEDTASGWEKLVTDAENDSFDYDYFRHVASKTFDILYWYSDYTYSAKHYPSTILRMISTFSRFYETSLSDETDLHMLAQNAASSFRFQSKEWIHVYRQLPKGLGGYRDAFIMPDIYGGTIVVDPNTFDLEHPMDKAKLAREGCFTMNVNYSIDRKMKTR